MTPINIVVLSVSRSEQSSCSGTSHHYGTVGEEGNLDRREQKAASVGQEKCLRR